MAPDRSSAARSRRTGRVFGCSGRWRFWCSPSAASPTPRRSWARMRSPGDIPGTWGQRFTPGRFWPARSRRPGLCSTAGSASGSCPSINTAARRFRCPAHAQPAVGLAARRRRRNHPRQRRPGVVAPGLLGPWSQTTPPPSCTGPVIVSERAGVVRGLVRSAELVRPRFWRLFASSPSRCSSNPPHSTVFTSRICHTPFSLGRPTSRARRHDRRARRPCRGDVRHRPGRRVLPHRRPHLGVIPFG